MDTELTSIYTAVGAGLGVLSFGWNVWTWIQGRRPRLAIEVEVRNVDLEPEIVYTIRNRGTQATTIEELQLIKYHFGPVAGLGLPERVEYVAACNPDSVQLPAVIQPGCVWTGSSPASESERRYIGDDWSPAKLTLIEKGQLFYKIRCSHFARMIFGRVRMERLLPFG